MDTEDTGDSELVARLKRLDASAAARGAGLRLRRHARAPRRSAARARAAGWCWRAAPPLALVVALVGASLWRLDEREPRR